MSRDIDLQAIDMDLLNPSPYNPRKIEDTNKTALKKAMTRFGMLQQIVWNKRSGNIVGGHQRYYVLKELGEIETLVVVVDLDESDEKALNLTLNNSKIEGDWTDFAEDLLNCVKQDDEKLFNDLNFESLQLEIERQIKKDLKDQEVEGEVTCPCCSFTWMYDDRDISDINFIE